MNRQVAERDQVNADASYLVAKTQLAMGKNLLKVKQSIEAERELESAKARMAKLVALDPANDEWAYMYFRMVSNLAIAAATNGKSTKARTNLAEGMAIALRYRDEQTSNYSDMQTGIAATQAAIALPKH